MTTFEPGARVVLTQGLVVRPRSTAFLASSAAPSITEGLDVLVQLVIEAITTAPWSSTNSPRSAELTGVGFEGRPSPPSAAENTTGAASSFPDPGAGESLAGKDSLPASSSPSESGPSEAGSSV